jgi:hypothetical protein
MTARELTISSAFDELTDAELLRRLHATKSMTALEIELTFRLQRALDEVDELNGEFSGEPRGPDRRPVLRLVQPG